MKTKNEILYELYETGFVGAYLRKINNNRYDQWELEDIEQDLWLMICELSAEKIQSLYRQGGINKVRQYCSGVIACQILSTHSYTFYRYRKHNQYQLVPSFEKVKIKQQ